MKDSGLVTSKHVNKQKHHNLVIGMVSKHVDKTVNTNIDMYMYMYIEQVS